MCPFAVSLIGGCSADDAEHVVLLAAYGSSASVTVEGRVIESRFDGGEPASSTDSRSTNLRRAFSIFTERLVRGREVEIELAASGDAGMRAPASGSGSSTIRAVTDEGGYFRANGVVPDRTGWVAFEVTVEAEEGDADSGARASGEMLIVPDENTVGIISDIDDTVLVTDVDRLGRMLENTLLRNPLQREAIAGSAALYRRTLAANPHPESAPMFYLSGSPRQLDEYIDQFLAINGFPRGVLETRRVGLESDDESPGETSAYKLARIDGILAALPGVRFVLVGDDGEDDPGIYASVRERYPTRIEAIWIRRMAVSDAAPLPKGQLPLRAVLASTDADTLAPANARSAR